MLPPNEEKPVPNNLTGKDVTDFTKDVSKDITKQTIVWTLSAMLTKGLRGVIEKLTK